MKIHFRSIILIFSLALVVSGCTGTKRPFVEITDIPQNKGVVYIYMPKKGNIAKNVNVAVDNTEAVGIKLGRLNRQHHMAYVAPVGENLFRIGNAAISIDVKNGMSYFVKMTSYKFFTYRFKLFNVDPTAGFQEVRATQPQAVIMY